VLRLFEVLAPAGLFKVLDKDLTFRSFKSCASWFAEDVISSPDDAFHVAEERFNEDEGLSPKDNEIHTRQDLFVSIGKLGNALPKLWMRSGYNPEGEKQVSIAGVKDLRNSSRQVLLRGSGGAGGWVTAKLSR
jgi:hypothetical protein